MDYTLTLNNKKVVRVATIAGSDASGGAGLEADLKTFEEFGVYGTASVTAIATMDADKGWAHSVFPVSEEALRAQLETLFKGVRPAAVKTGMLGAEYAVRLSAEYIKKYSIKNYVLDPVMVCKGAGEALNPELNTLLAQELLPLAEIATPNLFEAGVLSGISNIDSLEKMKNAAELIHKKGARNVFLKGGAKLAGASGHGADGKPGKSIDLFFDGNSWTIIEDELIATAWTHGAGCTTAAAICAGLARGLEPIDACRLAKKFITMSLAASFPLNEWVGPGSPWDWRKSF